MTAGYIRSVALTGSDQAVRAAPGIYYGICVRNTHAANAATIQLYDNASAASGTLIGTYSFAAGEEADVVFPKGIWVENGVYADIGGTGTIEGSVRIG